MMAANVLGVMEQLPAPPPLIGPPTPVEVAALRAGTGDLARPGVAPLVLVPAASAAQVSSTDRAFIGPQPLAAPTAEPPLTFNVEPAATSTVSVQKAAAQKIDLDVTIQSGLVAPTQAKDLNLLHFFGGEKLTVPTVVKNYGPGTASGSATVEIYLSTKNSLDNKSVLLGQKTVNLNLANNATQGVSLDVVVPKTLVEGTEYFIVAKVTTPLAQSNTRNDIRATDRKFEFVGTPTNMAAFTSDAKGNILYFNFIRDTLNNRLVAVDRDILVRINDPKSFIGSFQGDELYPYLKGGVPMIGVGVNLNTLDPTMTSLLASYVRGFAKQAYGQTLTGDDATIINMLKTKAYAGSTMPVISGQQDQSLFNFDYDRRQQVGASLLGQSPWSRVNPLARISLMDQIYATGTIASNMLAPLKDLDYVRAGFRLVDSTRATQSADGTVRVEAEYQELLYSTRTSLGQVI